MPGPPVRSCEGELRIASVSWSDTAHGPKPRRLGLGRLTKVKYEVIMAVEATEAA